MEQLALKACSSSVSHKSSISQTPRHDFRENSSIEDCSSCRTATQGRIVNMGNQRIVDFVSLDNFVPISAALLND